jgi:hypothetical protein
MSSGLTLNKVGDFVFAYAYPVSFVGALFLCTTQLFGIQIETFMNDNFANFMYIFIGACGFVSVFNWFGTSVPLIGSSILDPNAIKINNTQ